MKKDEIVMQTERLDFKIWNENKNDFAVSLWSNTLVCKYISVKGYFTEEEIKNRLNKEIENYKNYHVQYWPLFIKDTNEFIGCCGLRPYDIEKNIYEIGIHLLPQYWGIGYATEAMNKVIDYAFKTIKAKDLFAGHNPNNLPSKNMLKKLGFKFIRNEYYEPTGLMHPSYLYKGE